MYYFKLSHNITSKTWCLQKFITDLPKRYGITTQYFSVSAQQQPPSLVGDHVSGTTTHFGFEEVLIQDKESRVREVFEKVADNYDLMNDIMSGGLHRLWKDQLLHMTGIQPIAEALRRRASTETTDLDSSSMQQNPTSNLLSILDVAGGTGDVAFRFIEAAGCPERSKSSGLDEITVTVCDINPGMLRVGEKRARLRYGNAILDNSKALSFVEGNAQYLPFKSNSFDVYTIAFGLRNVTNIDMALCDAYRVLKPGGRFLCLEFSRVTDAKLSALYDLYSFNMIPFMGEVITQDRSSYQYLVESIRKFCTQDELIARMEKAGLTGCKYVNMTGGIVAVHEGWKPL